MKTRMMRYALPLVAAIRERKPVVKYRKISFLEPEPGLRAWIMPIDHPRGELNNCPCSTSIVVSVQPNGDFETLNTKYILDTEQQTEV